MRTTLRKFISPNQTTLNLRCRASLLAVVITLLSSLAQNSGAAGYADAVRADGPITYWRFNDAPPTAINSGSLGATADGTYNGDATAGAQAPRPPFFPGLEPGNTAVQLDGTGDFVSTLGSLLNSTPVFTISGWMRRNGDQAARTGLWGQNDIVEFGYIANQTLEVWTDNGLDIANSIPNTEWAHLAIVSDGSPGTMSMYTNGVLAGSRGHTLPANNAFAFNIGGGGVFDGTGNFFNGQIDEVAIFTNALSAATIAAQYGAAFTPIGSLPNTINIGQNKTGSVTNNGNNSYTILGGGNDIWDQRDEFTYAYTEVVGDFDVQVRVASLEHTATWTKAGLMARETLSEYSRMAFLRVTPTNAGAANDVRFAYRTGLDNVAGLNGGQHEDPAAAWPTPNFPNAWLRLVRVGATLFASNSLDGVAWNLVASQDTTAWGGGALSNKLFLGLAVSRHSGAELQATCVFTNFQFNSNAAPFAVVGAESRGNPNGVRVYFNRPVGAGGLTAANYTLTTVSGPNVTVVTGLRFTTANDAPARDPMTFTLEGTTADPAVGDWTLIASGNTGLATDPGRNTVGPIVPIANANGYRAYRLLFPTVRDAVAANSMQIAEIELLGAGDVDVTAPGDAIIGVRAIAGNSMSEVAVAGTTGGANNYPAAEHPGLAIDNVVSPSKYLNFAKTNTGVIVTPTGGAQPPNPTVSAAAPGPNDNTIQLTTSRLADGAVYELVVDANVLALDGTSLISALAGFTHGFGYEALRIRVTHNKTDDSGYYRISDATAKGIGDVIALVGGVFPPLQENVEFEDPIPDTGSNERFSTTIYGVLMPTTTGNHTFYMSSDDVGRMYLSTDSNPANKVQIASEPAWNGRREYVAGGNQATRGVPPANISAPISLQAGGKYYMELSFSEGGGGNNGSATWLPPGGAAVANGSPPITNLFFAPSRLFNGNIFNTLGPVRIISQPTNLTVLALTPATFGVRLDGTPDYTYQWRRNGLPIPGATGPTYTIPAAQLSDDQALYSVVVANEFSSGVSGNARLTVLVPTPPHLLSASADATFTTVLVRFDNRLEVASAQNLANYTLTNPAGPVAIVSATRAANARDVVLRTATAMPEDTLHTLIVREIHDETGTTTIESNPTNRTFTTFAFAPGYVVRQQHLSPNADYGFDAVDRYITEFGSGVSILRGECLSPTFEYNQADVGLPEFPGRPDNYGGRIAGYFTPPVSGDYTFYIAADDFARLFLSTDANPANRVLVAREPAWSARRTWTGEANGGGRGTPPANIYTATGLVGGQRYFIEAFFTEGGGGDNLGVDIQGPGDPVPNIGDAPRGGANLGTFVQAGTLTITNQPQGKTVTENAQPVFTVGAFGTSTLCGGDTLGYQWRSNGIPIPGANQPSFTAGPVSLVNSGDVYSVVVTSPGRSVTSSNALLSVVSDNVRPVLLSAKSDGSLTRIFLHWSELMSQGIAETPDAYVLNGPGIAAPGISPATATLVNGTDVILTFANPLDVGATYSLELDFQLDLVGLGPDPVGNPVIDTAHGVVTPVRTFVISPGTILFQAYNTGGGNAVSDLTTDPTYPNSPDLVRYITAMESRQVYPTDAREGYGATMTGYFVPQVTSNYTFYLASDDASELWLSTDAAEANKVLLTAETGCCNPFAAHASASIALVAGQPYWMQLLYKEGTGGDYGRAAVKFTADPVDPNTLVPIGGGLLASLADPTGASVTITQQPVNAVFVGGAGIPLASHDFTANNGGFTVTTPQAYAGPWAWNSGTGTWQENGQGPESGHPNTSFLDSPGLAVTASGQVLISFDHRWSREQDATSWDGNQLRVSVNGGPFTAVPAGSFTLNSYNGAVGANSTSDLRGQQAWVGTSPGFAGGFITSEANLGSFNAGDIVRVEFMAASDGNTAGPSLPGWEIDAVRLTQGSAQTVTFSVRATGTNSSQGATPTFAYQWYRDDGAGFVAIPGATAADYTFAPQPADNGAKFRAIVSIPGASATSATATLTVGTPITVRIQRSGGQITISWSGTFCLQEADQVTGPWVTSPRVNGTPFTPPATGNKFYRLIDVCPP